MGDNFGASVALAGDALVVGAPWHDASANSAGAAYAFTRSGGTWTQQAKLVASDPAGFDFFGESVAIRTSAVVVGAPGKEVLPFNHAGAAYVFERSGVTWSERAKLTAPDNFDDGGFGESVAIQRKHGDRGRARPHGGGRGPGGRGARLHEIGHLGLASDVDASGRVRGGGLRNRGGGAG